jgi:hypothetical protein
MNLSWGIGSTVESIGEIKVKLPIKNDNIDFTFMEDFIILVKKLILKDKNIEFNEKINKIKSFIKY